jgi:hypothetical protein
MPVRKLNQDKADALAAAYAEYDKSKPQPIVRLDAEGNEVVLRNHADIAKWGGISEGRYYELKNAGWQLKRGTGRPATIGPSVTADTVRTVYELSQELIAKRDARIHELEARVTELENQLRNALRGRSFP